MILEFFFFGKATCYVEEKREEDSTYTANVKMPTYKWKRQPENAKNGGKIMVTWSLLPCAFHLNVMMNLSEDKSDSFKRFSFTRTHYL